MRELVIDYGVPVSIFALMMIVGTELRLDNLRRAALQPRAVLLGRLLAYGLSPTDAPVLVIESAVRNVGIATILGRLLFSPEDFGTFAGFLTGYFIIEILIMLPYAQIVRSRILA